MSLGRDPQINQGGLGNWPMSMPVVNNAFQKMKQFGQNLEESSRQSLQRTGQYGPLAEQGYQMQGGSGQPIARQAQTFMQNHNIPGAGVVGKVADWQQSSPAYQTRQMMAQGQPVNPEELQAVEMDGVMAVGGLASPVRKTIDTGDLDILGGALDVLRDRKTINKYKKILELRNQGVSLKPEEQQIVDVFERATQDVHYAIEGYAPTEILEKYGGDPVKVGKWIVNKLKTPKEIGRTNRGTFRGGLDNNLLEGVVTKPGVKRV